MKRLSRYLILALTLVAAVAGGSRAETRYVTDQLTIIVREAPDDASLSLKSLRSDAAVQLLEEGEAYLKVRTADGVEGYVKKQYLTADVPKATQLAGLKAERDKLQQEVAGLKARIGQLQSGAGAGVVEKEQALDELKQQLAQSRKAADTATTELAALQKKYAALEQSSGNVLQVVTEREKLQADNERLARELETLQGENASLVRTSIAKWALTGAGILFLGWLMGKASRTKRRY